MAIGEARTTLGRFFSEGSRLLWLAKEARGLSQYALAAHIGVKHGMPAKWLYGDTCPKLAWATKLRDLFGIPLEAWSSAPDEPFAIPRPALPRSPDSSAELPAVSLDDDAAGAKTERDMPAVPPSPSSEPPPRTAAA